MNKNDVKQSVNIRDEFHFSEVHRSMNATVPCKVNDVTYFARDPLRSYFDEPQKNEIYFLKEFW